MSIKSVMMAFRLEEEAIPDGDIDAAIGFCVEQGAHLTVAIAAPTFEVTSGFLLGNVHAMIEEANRRLAARAAEVAAQVRARAATGDATLRTEIVCRPYYLIRERLAAMARVNDLVLLSRSKDGSASGRDLAEDLLFTAGRPLLLLPDVAPLPANLRRVVVAWDGSARAGRAVGDAMVLLEKAETVEVLGVTGVEDHRKALDGVEIAEHLARHCRSVTLTSQAGPGGDVAGTIRRRMGDAGADLLVMGGFAHSRLRQMVLGGVTSAVLAGAPFPVMMSY
jgi:nucleotide-binding universal stress UspA family protein